MHLYLLSWTVSAILFPLIASAEDGITPPAFAGRWIGSALNDQYTAEAVVFVRPSADPLLMNAVTLSGTITLKPGAQGGASIVAKISGEQAGMIGRGNITYTDQTGQVRGAELRTEMTALFPNLNLKITVNSSVLGALEFALIRSPGIAGIWLFPDGNAVTITRQEDGSYVGTYQGTAASGHTGLSGRLGGVFDERTGVWDGIFTITEGSVLATGRFLMTRGGTAPDETLEGTFAGSSNIDPVVRTNPVKLARGEG